MGGFRNKARGPARMGSIVFVSSLGLFSTACSSTSGGDPRCFSEPEEPLVVFLEGPGEGGTRRIEGQLIQTIADDDLGFRTLVFRDQSGRSHRLRMRAPLAPLPFEEGVDYALQVDYLPGFPSANGILVTDAEGVVLAGVADQGSQSLVLKGGIPGLEIELLPTDCPRRRSDECYQGIFNGVLRVTDPAETVELYQRESKRLGRYAIHCLVAQEIHYSENCLDAGLNGLSYLIVRVE